jgi:probable rRNA maturation factor
MQILVYNKQKDLSISTYQTKKILKHLLESLKVDTNEISLHFVSKNKICELHEQFFDDPTTTDCITLPIDAPGDNNTPHHILGEIFVCPHTAVEYANKKGIDPYKETLLYIVHGVLHLLGYDDIDPKDRQMMRKKEKKCLSLLTSFSLNPHKKELS